MTPASRRQPPPSARPGTALLVANGCGILAAAVFAAVGVRRPAYVAAGEGATPLAQFWAGSSAVRTWALAGPLVVALARPGSPGRSALLTSAGLVQLGDAALGVQRRYLAMATLPAVVGALHLLSARLLCS